MKTEVNVRPSESLRHVRYEIRGRLARRAHEMQRMGYEIVSLNIGNPGAFGFRTPETMRLAMIENLSDAEGYCHQKGIFPDREAVVMQQQGRGVTGVTAEEVFIGNGVSELIDLVLRALINEGDEVLGSGSRRGRGSHSATDARYCCNQSQQSDGGCVFALCSGVACQAGRAERA